MAPRVEVRAQRLLRPRIRIKPTTRLRRSRALYFFGLGTTYSVRCERLQHVGEPTDVGCGFRHRSLRPKCLRLGSGPIPVEENPRRPWMLPSGTRRRWTRHVARVVRRLQYSELGEVLGFRCPSFCVHVVARTFPRWGVGFDFRRSEPSRNLFAFDDQDKCIARDGERFTRGNGFGNIRRHI